MWARVILSLGGTSPERATTWRGRMVKAAAPAAVPRNLRRLESLDIWYASSGPCSRRTPRHGRIIAGIPLRVQGVGVGARDKSGGRRDSWAKQLESQRIG